jgi:hypothetical protein
MPMSRFAVNIANIVLTNEQYRKLRVYAEAQEISIHEALRLLIDSLPESSPTNKQISKNYKNYPFLFSRRVLHAFFNIK